MIALWKVLLPRNFQVTKPLGLNVDNLIGASYSDVNSISAPQNLLRKIPCSYQEWRIWIVNTR